MWIWKNIRYPPTMSLSSFPVIFTPSGNYPATLWNTKISCSEVNCCFPKQMTSAPTPFCTLLINGNLPVEHYIHPGLSYYENFVIHRSKHGRTCAGNCPTGDQLLHQGISVSIILFADCKPESKSFLDKIGAEIAGKTGNSSSDNVEQHYAEPITISQMAKLCYFSPSHFMKFFKSKYLGTSFYSNI